MKTQSIQANSFSKGAATRDAIVQAALKLAETGGLEGLSIGNVAERVGMSKSGVFAHFGSREDLQLAVLKAATENFSEAVFHPAIKLKRGLPRLRAVLKNMIEFYKSLANGCVILSASHEFDDQPGPIRDAVLAYLRQLRSELIRAARYAQEAGELNVEYLGKKTPEKIGRECHVIKRVCPRVEIDAFEIGGTASTDPKVVAVEGFTEVTIYIDAERWLQVGTELYRTEPDGTRVLVGAYYFRDVQLNPGFPPDAFTVESLKK